ncbi:MAG TPA: single-stranded-DNA-specific exonuclease RecJ [Rhodospirillales bacterium]|nr:single-stranded-DNA-specific exonuclease RecJ [Rhodospirillales bacterium]
MPGFLEPKLRDWLPDPSHLLDLDRAVERLARAVQRREPVGLVGDYDVDGATATALLGGYLRALGCPVEVRVPDRIRHGYGPHPELLAELAAGDIRLLVTLDCGTTAFAPLAEARDRGLEVVVIDHHSAEAELPPALAVVNPNRQDQESPLGTLAAVGVTFVLLVALNRALREAGFWRGREEPDLLSLLDLVALGTVCDVVPLAGLNRAFVAQGLKVAGRTRLPGLRALAAAAGIESIGASWHLGFALGPRLNAAGRIGRSDLAVRLLLAEEEGEAETLALELERLNRERQRLEREVLADALRQIEPQLAEDRPLLLAHARGWHPGVVGIVAGRLLERFGRPVFVLGERDGTLRGSARSVPGFDIGAAVIDARRQGLLTAGGGHPLAAGATLAADRMPAFARFLLARAEAGFGTTPPGPPPLRLDGSLAVAAVAPELARQVARMAPFGPGNAEPRFCLTDAVPVEGRIVGDSHVSCWLAGADGRRVRAIAFRAVGTPVGERLLAGRTRFWIAGRLRHEVWQGRERASFEIEDLATPPTGG